MAGVVVDPAEGPIDGLSFVSLCHGKAEGLPDRAFFWHFPHTYFNPPYSVVRQGDWKLIYHHVDQRYELFNLRHDLGEKTNLAQKEPAKRAELAALLAARLQELEAPMPLVKATGKPVPLPR